MVEYPSVHSLKCRMSRPREGDWEGGREGAKGSLSLAEEIASERSGVRRMRE